jgi:hypothetical protein
MPSRDKRSAEAWANIAVLSPPPAAARSKPSPAPTRPSPQWTGGAGDVNRRAAMKADRVDRTRI